MCQSLAEGGKRCSAHTPTGRALKRLAKQQDKQIRAKDINGAFESTRNLSRLKQACRHYGNVVTPMEMELPDTVHEAFGALTAAGFRPLVVGGSVRDALTDGRAPKDVDVEVYGATLDETIATLKQAGYRVDEVGKAFGVLKVLLSDGTDLDVSVPRRDNHTGAGHRGFTVETDTTMTATEAAARRDFTINALGYDPEFGVCVDPYGGRADLKAGVLRATTDAFAEDPLRVLRGFQFAARYGMDLDPDTAQVCQDLVPRASELPVERVRGEWSKFYTKGTHASHGLTVLAQTGWDTTIPGLAAANTDETRRRVAHVADAAATADPDLRARVIAATIARDMNDSDARAFMHHTLEGGDLQRAAYGLSRATYPDHGGAPTDTEVRAWAHTLGAAHTNVSEWTRVQQATVDGFWLAEAVQAKAQALGCADGPQPDLIAGRDIINRFTDRKPGPWTGQVQRAARQAQVEGVFTTTAQAQAWLADYQLDG
jgi:tRNA nucleotidyltransferase (CCA-adding enzyme)